jgi:hypothetical protein
MLMPSMGMFLSRTNECIECAVTASENTVSFVLDVFVRGERETPDRV